ncbi:MAG: hypothetical protein ACLPIC_08370 [Rhodoblastus sp.]|uniref:hypothetical protein n=1 Tax=Rhodoblastus sp. TaxID=1962975 RepID=UPI003F96ACDA
MINRPRFDARSPAEAGVSFIQSLFAPLFRPATVLAPEVLAPKVLGPRPSSSRCADPGADACWTASLQRGDGLIPFLVCIDLAAGQRFAMRFESFSRRTDVGPRLR